MQKKHIYIIAGSILAIASVIFFSKSAKTEVKIAEINPAFSEYIAGFTSGVIHKNSPIRIRFMEDIPREKRKDQGLFSFTPGISGSILWLDARTIEFSPDELLPSGVPFYAELFLSQLIDVPEDLKTFAFNFETLMQSMEVRVDGMKAFDKKTLDWQRITGTLQTADAEELSVVKKTLTATQDGSTLPIRWQQDISKLSNSFTVDSVSRKKDASEVVLAWDGSAINCDVKGEEHVEVPALGDFKVMSVTVNPDGEQFVRIQYSDPLDENQNLLGLVTINGVTQVRHVIIDNDILVYPATRIQGQHNVHISAGIKNIMGYKTKEEQIYDVLFEILKPAVRFVGKGVILPGSSQGMVLPFEAVSLNAVDVQVIKIYENNIAQFLQVNDLENSYELTRVGKPVLQKTIRLDQSGVVDFGRWNRYNLDLNELIKQETGAIYHVTLGFRKSHAVYDCAGSATTEDDSENTWSAWPDQQSGQTTYWDDFDDYYYDDYDYRERDNPCHSAYYGGRRSVSRNILASNLGVIAQRGEDGQLHAYVTDLRTAKPVANVILDVLDYQQQVLASSKTDADGMATVSVKEKPYLLIAKQAGERGYLKLDNGSSLSMSRFDISGDHVQKGIKGFIYGERGVWRPGDSLFVAFMLEDKLNTLPKNQPIIFELRNPDGQMVKRIVGSETVNGVTKFVMKTEPDAPTGNWSAKVKVGGAEFHKQIKIETIKPNRLKIDLNFGEDALDAEALRMGIPFHTEWLHGGIAKNLRVKIDATLSQSVTKFKRFTDYTFDDPSRSYYGEEQTVFEGQTDAQGNAQIHANIKPEGKAPGMLTAKFLTKVFEPGGDFSQDRFTISYHPYDYYVGVKLPKGDELRGMLLTDKDHPVKLLSVNTKGEVVPNRRLEVKFYKASWRWWWDNSEDNLTSYYENSYHTPLMEGTVTTDSKGEGTFNIKVAYPDWGRYFVRVVDLDGGHSTGKAVYIDWPGWAGRARNDGDGGAAMLSFTADKQEYQVGESVSLTIPSAKNGRALVTIESGSSVLDAKWLETVDGQTSYSFPVTKAMAPNVYIHVSLLQPHGQEGNDRPIRMYGVVPIKVVDPFSIIKPVISMPDVLRPEEDVTISVSEASGHPMTYTIAIVDEGLLGLTRFKTPDPWSAFYAKEALNVKTWDIYDMVMGAYGGKLDKLLAVGGDEVNRPKGGKKAQRFKPMVRYLGPFYLKSGKQNHRVHIPRYIGAVRTMVIAGDNGAYGAAEKSTPVRKPVMVLATLPRVIAPGEHVGMPVTVFAMEKNVKKVQVNIKTEGQLKLMGPASQSVSFSEVGDQTIHFDLKVLEATGTGKVIVTATSGSEKATYEVEMEVRPPNLPSTEVISQMIPAGQSWSPDFDAFGLAGTNRATIEVSSLPPLDLEKRIRYLIQYPHGCVEQTTSGAFPQLYLDALMELTPTAKQTIRQNINAAIQRLLNFQQPGGGMSYWPGNSDYSEWGTTYAGHFMIEAAAKGYSVPTSFLTRWVKFQTNQALQWKYDIHHSDMQQAYRLYTLALAKSPAMGAMNRLRESSNLSTAAKWRLAAAYALSGQIETAKKLTMNLPKDSSPYQELSYTYGSRERDLAMVLETLLLLKQDQEAFKLLQLLSKELSTNRWMSTQTLAYSLLAVGKYSQNVTSSTLDFSTTVNNGKVILVKQTKPVHQQTFNPKMKDNKVIVKNTSNGALYARICMQGIPPAGEETDGASDLTLYVSYKTLDGYAIDVSRLEQGTDFMAEVTITHTGVRGIDYDQMALSQLFPCGWEIINTRLDDNETLGRGIDQPTYQDIRDDRVYTYFNVGRSNKKTFRVLLNASYLGHYYLPAVQASAMYDETIYARKKGQWVDIVRSPEQ